MVCHNELLFECLNYNSVADSCVAGYSCLCKDGILRYNLKLPGYEEETFISSLSSACGFDGVSKAYHVTVVDYVYHLR